MAATSARAPADPARRPRRAVLRAVLLHGEGTIAETERDGHRVAFNQAFRDAGFDWDWDHVLYGRLLRHGGARERLRHYLRHYRPCGGPRRDVEPFVDAILRAQDRAYEALVLAGALRPRPGVERLLREAAAAGIELVLATGGTRRGAELLLSQTLGPGGPGLFRSITTPGQRKGAQPAPGGALAVTDSRPGLMAAAGAGIPTIVTPSWYTDRGRFTEARLVVSGLGEPGEPFRVLRGDPAGHGFVSVAALRAWYPTWSAG